MSQARIAGLVFGLVAVGCGPKGDSAGAAPAPAAGPSSPSASAGSPAKAAASVAVDPCLLITKAEAEAALGMSVTGPETTRDESGATCTYTHATTTLSIAVGAHASNPATIEGLRKIYGENTKSLSGIGDAAFRGPGGMIFAVKHATSFIINPGIISDEKSLGLARTAASRL
jgi:hypothetical protein